MFLALDNFFFFWNYAYKLDFNYLVCYAKMFVILEFIVIIKRIYFEDKLLDKNCFAENAG